MVSTANLTSQPPGESGVNSLLQFRLCVIKCMLDSLYVTSAPHSLAAVIAITALRRHYRRTRSSTDRCTSIDRLLGRLSIRQRCPLSEHAYTPHSAMHG